MKVVLLQDVKKIGRRFEVKEVSDGYARNFLIPNKLAQPADEKGMQAKAKFDADEIALTQKYEAEAARLKQETLTFKVKADDQVVFGSVKAGDIEKTLQGKGFSVERVVLEKPLRTLGDHAVALKFKRGVSGTTTVRLERS